MTHCENEFLRELSDSPHVDIRVVLFSVSEGRLWIALKQSQWEFALPCGRPTAAESLDVSATRILASQVGVRDRYMEQLYSVSPEMRKKWSVAITYLGLAAATPGDQLPASAAWFEVSDLPDLDVVDGLIVDYALLRLRAKLGYTTIAFHLLPSSFSLSELQQVYEAVLGRPLDKRNFRRRIQSEGFLEATGATRREGSHRPARLYRFRAEHDAETYLTPVWATKAEKMGERAT